MPLLNKLNLKTYKNFIVYKSEELKTKNKKAKSSKNINHPHTSIHINTQFTSHSFH